MKYLPFYFAIRGNQLKMKWKIQLHRIVSMLLLRRLSAYTWYFGFFLTPSMFVLQLIAIYIFCIQ